MHQLRLFAQRRSILAALSPQRHAPCAGGAWLCLALLLFALPTNAQNSSSISGRAVDANGAAMPNVEVRLLLKDASLRTTITDERGIFLFDRVPPGEHLLAAQATGFAPTEQRVQVASGEQRRVDLVLRPDALSAQVTVTATRTLESVATVPSAITIVARDQLEQQRTVSRSVAEALGWLVPGLALGNQSFSINGQTLRGRNLAVLIDGIPQSTTINVRRDLFNIDASAIERIEVLRGPTAIYGDGATGGVINIITRAPGEGPVRFTTDLGLGLSLTHPEGSLSPRIQQSASGRIRWFDFFASGAFEHIGSFFDAKATASRRVRTSKAAWPTRMRTTFSAKSVSTSARSGCNCR